MLCEAGYGSIEEIYKWDYDLFLVAQYTIEKKGIDSALEMERLERERLSKGASY